MRRALFVLSALMLLVVPVWSQGGQGGGGQGGGQGGGGAGGQVTLDANATADVNSFASTITNNNLTVGSGSNRCLVAQLNFWPGGATPTGVAVSWNGTLMTQIGTEGTTFLFGLANPASGNNALVATWSGGSLFVALNGTSFTNCAQTGTFINVNTARGSGTTTSLAVTNPSGNIAIDSVAGSSPLSFPTQTQLYVDNASSFTGASYTSSINPTFSWTLGDSGTWYDVGASIAEYTQ